jgi:hypothetical protein
MHPKKRRHSDATDTESRTPQGLDSAAAVG